MIKTTVKSITFETEDVVTSAEAAVYLGVARITVDRWIESGKIAAIKIGHNVYLEKKFVEKLKK